MILKRKTNIQSSQPNTAMNKCHKCGKPVYFAERKTSLGKEWHPSCLRCDQCEKVLTPGQHAEHKGNPYCNQCYQALFGPQMFGYGSNVFSQANYRRKQVISIKDKIRKEPPTLQKSGNVIAVTHSDTEDKNEDVAEEIYETKRGKRLEDVEEEEEDEGDSFDCDTLKPRDNHCKMDGLSILSLPINNSDALTMPANNSLKNGHALSAMNKEDPSSSASHSSPAISLPLNYSNSLPADYRSLPAKTNTTLPSSITNGSSSSTNNHVDLSSSVVSSSGSCSSLLSLSSQETLISPFMSTSQRIFGSLSSPLNLDTLTSPINYGTLVKIFANGILPNQETDDSRRQKILEQVQSYNAFYEGKRGCLTMNQVNGEDIIEGQLRIYWQVTIPIQLKQCDDVPVPPIASWRHSYYAAIGGNGFEVDGSHLQSLESPSSSPMKYGLDDSMIIPSSDGVVRRRNIRKSNTVAYRADRPNKWKRASINGHIYNYDTRVFTPVIGSCTSVTVNNSMTVPHVIRTLLEKFKVENDAEEFSLYVVTEEEGERELHSNDVPLLERLSLGPDETNAKIFIREKDFETSVVVEEAETLEEKTLNLPAEAQHTLDAVNKGTFELNIVEQLMALPDGVLKGLLQKFMDDEEKDVQKIREKYTKIKTVVNDYLSLTEQRTNDTTNATEGSVTTAQ